jgi:transaldolase
MELFLESNLLEEIEWGKSLGFLNGLSTNYNLIKQNEVDLDALLLKIAYGYEKIFVEIHGNTSDELIHEAHRLLSFGLEKENVIVRIASSLEGIKACNVLRTDGFNVCIFMVYNLQQAYMAMHANASYVEIAIHNLLQQGFDGMQLLERCTEAIDYYGYDSKILFSGVNHKEAIQQALTIGVHAIAVPKHILLHLSDNTFTKTGKQENLRAMRLSTLRVKDVLRASNPVIHLSDSILEAVVQMSKGGMGAVAVLNEKEELIGVFTDGDLRRQLQQSGKDILGKKLGDLVFKQPTTIDANAFLGEAYSILKEKRIDNILVTDATGLIGMLDIQDID